MDLKVIKNIFEEKHYLSIQRFPHLPNCTSNSGHLVKTIYFSKKGSLLKSRMDRTKTKGNSVMLIFHKHPKYRIVKAM